jgi:hypothetical protein
MDEMKAADRREQKKNEIKEVMKRYQDEHGNVDLTKLRLEEPKVYRKIPYYFKSIDNALAEFNGVAAVSPIPNKGGSINRLTLRNQLAWDMLKELREKHTLEEISSRYGVSRAHVNQLYQALSKSIGANENEEEIETETNDIDDAQ